jgi:hypothetical protein
MNVQGSSSLRGRDMVEFDLPDGVLTVTATGPVPEPEEFDGAASGRLTSVTCPGFL